MSDQKIGVITHYYDKIGVAVVELSGLIKVGERIKISDRSNEFEQEINSMQVEHEEVQEAKKGQAIGLKIDQPVKKGAEVYKVG